MNRIRIINVRFRNEEDLKKFENLMGQKFNSNKKKETIWFSKNEGKNSFKGLI